jgi:ribosome-binding factor A
VAQPLSPERAKSLCATIKDENAFANCVFDVMTTADPGMAKAYLRSLRLREAAMAGLP